MVSVTPWAYADEVDDVRGFDASVDRTIGTGLHPGHRRGTAVPGSGTVVGGPERFGRGDGEVLAPAEPAVATLIGLSERDVAVLRFLADGWTTAEIAHEMAYAESTIKKEVHLIVHHMGARNRTHAVALAVRGSLV